MTGSPQWQAQVLAKRRAGAYTVLTVSAPGLAALCRPGHFASVAIGGSAASALLLRRQLWLGEVSGSGRDGGSMELVVDPGEPGGRWLSGLEQGAAVTTVDIIAPLGRPFSLPREPANAILVAFGGASAALLPLAARLVERGSRVRFLLVGEAYGLLEARRLAAGVEQVSDAAELPNLLADSLGAEVDVVYSAGSGAQVQPVADAAGHLPHQTAIATPQVCAAGTCTACAIPVAGRDGVHRIVRGCVEGAVFSADLVLWDDLAGPAHAALPIGRP